MKYTSTRNSKTECSGSEAIVNGISNDGGLYVPSSFPLLQTSDFEHLIEKSYPERAANILSLFLDEFSEEELLEYTKSAYDRFDGDPCPLVNIDEGIFMMELWHGPTFAFKDMALTLLPHLMTACKKKLGINEETLILVATSGDTGKAALEGFKDVKGTSIIVLYPNEGVSEMQKLQMITQEGDNVCVGAIKGNFDDAQTAVKKIFADSDIKAKLKEKGISLSSANSINWGRLVPQIVYYISAYCDLVSSGEIEIGDKINFSVPTGNFGNILAGFYAYKMGVPINKLICASNENKILTDFFNSGIYDTERKFHKTISPSMDILISSNLERLLFEITGRDDSKINELMTSLKNNKKYELDKKIINKNAGIFYAGFATEEDTKDTINNFFEVYDYMLDPHTAVAVFAHNNYSLSTDDNTPTVIVSTASPYKFPATVYEAITGGTILDDPFKACKKLYGMSALEIPEEITNLRFKDVRFDKVLSKDEISDFVLNFKEK